MMKRLKFMVRLLWQVLTRPPMLPDEIKARVDEEAAKEIARRIEIARLWNDRQPPKLNAPSEGQLEFLMQQKGFAEMLQRTQRSRPHLFDREPGTFATLDDGRTVKFITSDPNGL